MADKENQPSVTKPTPPAKLAVTSTKPISSAKPASSVPKEPVKSEADKKKEERMNHMVKELEQAFFTIKFYPVAAKEEAKKDALERIRAIFHQEEETIRQLVLFMAHEHLAQAAEVRVMHNLEHFKRKLPTADPAQLRINVYRSMFNHNFSIEGLMDFVMFLATLEGDDVAKLLTYHFTYFSSMEGEFNRMMRNTLINALGESKSPYALHALLSYARTVDDESLLGRIAVALGKWDEKIEDLKLSRKDKDKLKADIQNVMLQESGSSHYG
jgi:hypothetical protein